MSYPCPVCSTVFDSKKARATHGRKHTGPSVLERFWSRVDTSAGLFGCWPWIGHRVAKGYGRIVVDGKTVGTHRLSLSMALGRPLAPDMDACHTCDNPPCCNPVHLFEGTQLDNVADRDQKGRTAAGSQNGRARLTEALVREIRALAQSGAGPTAISVAFGVPVPTVKHVVARHTWQQVA